MISSPDNDKLKTIRKLADKRWRDKLDLFCAEGEDLVDAADAAGWEPEFALRAGVDIEPELLADVSSLGSGTRAIGVYQQRWSELGGDLSVYLHGVADPGNVGAVIRTAHAFADGPVALGPDCADPFSPKAVRASMGSVFARPPAVGEPDGNRLALDPRAEASLEAAELEPPVVLCLGSERDGLPGGLGAERVRIPMREGGPESLNVAAAAAIGLYELAHRMAGHG